MSENKYTRLAKDTAEYCHACWKMVEKVDSTAGSLLAAVYTPHTASLTIYCSIYRSDTFTTHQPSILGTQGME